MMDNSLENRPRRSHGGFFWPLLLIAVGVVVLLNNTGRLSGDMWNSILRLWPLIFILMALDSIFKREGVVGAALVVGLGTLFLLSNFGFLTLSVWSTLLRLWPLFLLAWGFDILVGRRSWLASLAGAVVILAILVGLVFSIGMTFDRGQAASGQVRQALESGADSAKISIEPGAGGLYLKKLVEPVALVMGSIRDEELIRITESYTLENGQANYSLRIAQGNFILTDAETYDWNLGLATDIPIDLHVGMGAGEVKLDLTGLNLSALDVQLAVGDGEIVLPASCSFSGEIENAIGMLEITIPSGVEVVIEVDKALSTVQVGSGIVQDGDVYSTGGGGAKYRITLKVSQAIGTIILKRQ